MHHLNKILFFIVVTALFSIDAREESTSKKVQHDIWNMAKKQSDS